MAVSVSATVANRWLDYLRGTSPAAVSAVYYQLHTANPGTAGTTSVSSVTTRVVATFAASSGGVITQNGTAPEWTSWAGTNGEVVSHISAWDASTSGNFLWSAALSASKTMNTGDTLRITSSSVTVTTAS